MVASPQQAHISFQNLHLDILLNVIQFLDPFEVVVLGMTCRSLRETSVHRSVWIPLLNKICASNALFKPTYNIPQLSVIEIQRVVFSPARIISLYNKHLCSSDRILPATTERLILPGVLDTAGNFTRFLFLIPGGRFLVSYSGYWRNLCVWDLDAITNKHATGAKPLVEWKYRLQTPIACSQDPTGTAIRIGALATSLSEDLLGVPQCHVFECKLASTAPTTHVYRASAPRYLGNIMLRLMTGDIFVEIDDNCIHLWDIIRDLWLSWKHGLETVRAAFIDCGRVILVSFDWIRGWKCPFPGSRSWVGLEEVSPLDFSPDFTLPINQPSSPSYHLSRNQMSVYRSASSWYSGHSVAPFLFDIIESGSSSEYFTVSYNIHASSADGSANNARIEDWATTLIQDLNYGDLPIGWDSWRMLEGQIFKCFSNFDTIQLSVIGDNVTKAADRVYSYYDPVVSLENTGDNLLQFGEFTFDPISGRLCYASLLDEGSIVVSNFHPQRTGNTP